MVERDAVIVAAELSRGDSAQQAQFLPPGDYVDLVTGAALQTPISLPARSAVVLGVP